LQKKITPRNAAGQATLSVAMNFLKKELAQSRQGAKKNNSRKDAKTQRIPLCASAPLRELKKTLSPRRTGCKDAKVLPSVGRPACRKKIYQSAGFFCEYLR
jgi:hypothetical protein